MSSFGSLGGGRRPAGSYNPRLAGLSSSNSKPSSTRLSLGSTGSISRSLTSLPFGGGSSVDQYITTASNNYVSPSYRRSPHARRPSHPATKPDRSRALSHSNLNTTPSSTYSSPQTFIPSNQNRARINRPISNASSTTSLNSRGTYDTDDAKSVTSAASSTSLNNFGTDDKGDSTNNGHSYGYDSPRSSRGHTASDKDVPANSSSRSSLVEQSSEEIDYKKLCKQLIKENETLRKKIKDLEDAEKKKEQEFNRERRSMQRTLSEHEEELKSLNEIKADNARLKDENAALIRVISKLSK